MRISSLFRKHTQQAANGESTENTDDSDADSDGNVQRFIDQKRGLITDAQTAEGGVDKFLKTGSVGATYAFDNPAFSVQDTIRGSGREAYNEATGENLSKEEFAQKAADAWQSGEADAKEAVTDGPLAAVTGMPQFVGAAVDAGNKAAGKDTNYEEKGDDLQEEIDRAAIGAASVVAGDFVRNFTGIDPNAEDGAGGEGAADAFAFADVLPGAGKAAGSLAKAGTKAVSKQSVKQGTTMGIGSIFGSGLEAGAKQLSKLGVSSGSATRGLASTTDDGLSSVLRQTGDASSPLSRKIGNFRDDVIRQTRQTDDGVEQTLRQTDSTGDDALDSVVRNNDNLGDDTADAVRRGDSGADDTIEQTRRGDTDSGSLSTSRLFGGSTGLATAGGITGGLGGAYVGTNLFGSDGGAGGSGSGDGNGDGSGGGGGGDSAGQYDETTVGELRGGWMLVRRDYSDGSQKFYVGGVSDGDYYFITASGGVEEVPGYPEAEIPLFDSEQAARDAHQKWLDQNGEESGPDGEGDPSGSGGSGGSGSGGSGSESGWSEWQQVQELEYGWFVFGREHTSGKLELALVGTKDGQRYYINSDGEVQEKAVVFSSMEELQAAWNAFLKRVQQQGGPQGNDEMSGTPPRPGKVGTDSASTGASMRSLVGIAALGGALYLYQKRNGGN